jgi:hypothetical protein
MGSPLDGAIDKFYYITRNFGPTRAPPLSAGGNCGHFTAAQDAQFFARRDFDLLCWRCLDQTKTGPYERKTGRADP